MEGPGQIYLLESPPLAAVYTGVWLVDEGRVRGDLGQWWWKGRWALEDLMTEACKEGGVWKDSQLFCWWRKKGQRGPKTTNETFQISSHLSLTLGEESRARVSFLCFVSSLNRHIKQNGPAWIFKWCFKPRGSSAPECAFHNCWHLYQHVLAKQASARVNYSFTWMSSIQKIILKKFYISLAYRLLWSKFNHQKYTHWWTY